MNGEPTRKAAHSSQAPELWTDADPVRLFHLLENIDGLKQEVQDRMRRIEAVNKAKSLLQEDAIRTEALNRKLAELGRAFGEVRHDNSHMEGRNRETELLRMPAREASFETPVRSAEATEFSPQSQGLAEVAPWPTEAKVELGSQVEQVWNPGGQKLTHSPYTESANPELQFSEAASREPAPSEDWLSFESASHTSWSRHNESELQEPFMVATIASSTADAFASSSEQFPAFGQAIDSEPQPNQREDESPTARPLLAGTHAVEATEHIARPSVEFGLPVGPEHGTGMHPQESLQAELSAPLESYREAAARFTEAAMKMEAMAQAAADAKAYLDAAANQMEGASLELGSAKEQLEQARGVWTESSESLQSARKTLDESTAQLNLYRSKEEAATADLKSAQQDLTTAYQFASVAAQRQNDAAAYFVKSNRWTIYAFAASWIVLTLAVSLQFRATVPVFVPAALGLAILAVATIAGRRSLQRE